MPVYFKPKPTKNNGNYVIVRRKKNGVFVRDQLPCEGIYTKYEMSNVIGNVPGEWIKTKPGDTAYIFGLRQLINKQEKQ